MAGPAGFLVFDSARPWRSWPRRMQWGALVALAGLVVSMLWGQWHWQSKVLKTSRGSLRALETRQAAASSSAAHGAKTPAQAGATGTSEPRPDPAQWPEATQALDAWVRDAAQLAAKNNGVLLQQLTITRPDAAREGEAPPPPYAQLKINARGAYPALKAWQAEMQALMPSLGLESLRWQAPPNDGTGQLTAEWAWRLWVRPPGVKPVPKPAPAGARGTPAAWRPAMQAAARDPFGMAVAPEPPAPVAQVVEPPPVSAPVAPVAPPLQWTTVGRLRGPDGRQRLTGHWGDENETVSLVEGGVSPAGHQVLRITATLMELQHPETKERLSFRLPPSPRFETR